MVRVGGVASLACLHTFGGLSRGLGKFLAHAPYSTTILANMNGRYESSKIF